jgi:hypothetical protein
MSINEKKNVRQQEREARLRDMVIHALCQKKENIEKDVFLAQYRVQSGSGEYASLRYFNDFVTIGFFIEDNGTFTLSKDPELLAYLRSRFNIPKTTGNVEKAEKKQNEETN